MIHTSSYVTTLTEESSQIIPLIFRGKKIETTIVETNTRSDCININIYIIFNI